LTREGPALSLGPLSNRPEPNVPQSLEDAP